MINGFGVYFGTEDADSLLIDDEEEPYEIGSSIGIVDTENLFRAVEAELELMINEPANDLDSSDSE